MALLSLTCCLKPFPLFYSLAAVVKYNKYLDISVEKNCYIVLTLIGGAGSHSSLYIGKSQHTVKIMEVYGEYNQGVLGFQPTWRMYTCELVK